MSDLEKQIRAAVESGAMVTLMKLESGDYSAGASRPLIERFVSRRGPDPIATLRAAMTEFDRLERDGSRAAAAAADPAQIDLEEAIAAADFGDLIG